MLLECRRCGAPLDVEERARTARCRYCNANNLVAKTTQIAPGTPADWSPPKTWTPPKDKPAPSKPLPYREPRKGGCGPTLAGILGLAGLAIGVTAWLSTASVSDMAQLDVAGGPEQAASLLGGNQDDDAVRFTPRFTSFGSGHLDFADGHLQSVTFGGGDPDDIEGYAERLRDHLGPSLAARGDGSYRASYPNAGLTIFDEVLTMNGSEDEAGWRPRVAALWKAILIAVFEVDVRLTEAELALVQGARVVDLDDLPIDLTVEDAEAVVSERFPGAAVETGSSGVEAKVVLRHPWFGWAELDWNNEPGARAEELELVSRAPSGGFGEERLAAIATCLRSVFGEGQTRVQDYMAGTQDYEWRLPYGSARARGNRVRIPLSRGTTFLAAETRMELLQALDACQ